MTEQKPKHTPGPWQFYADLPSTEPNWHIVTNASRMRVLANVHIEPGNAMDLANACLIAAAPDLLKALRALFDDYKALADSGDAGFWKLEETPEGQQALAAIARATGKQEG